MPDLQTEWAGVLQRWGNSSQTLETSGTLTSGTSGTDSNSNYNKYDSLHRQSSNYKKNESHDTERQSSNYKYDKYDSQERQSSNYSKYESHDRQSGQGKSVRQGESNSERQNTRDRQERESLAGGKTGGRPRWSSVSRGSVSPGKENCETIGYR